MASWRANTASSRLWPRVCVPSFWCGATENRSFSTLSRLKIASRYTHSWADLFRVSARCYLLRHGGCIRDARATRANHRRLYQAPSTASVAIALPRSSRVGVGAAPLTKILRKDPMKSEAILPLARSLAAGCECGCVKSSGHHQAW